MAKYGTKYVLYQYDQSKKHFPYSPIQAAYAHDYRSAFIKLIPLIEATNNRLQSYFIGHYKTLYPKSCLNIWQTDPTGLLAQMELYRAASSRTIANRAATLHKRAVKKAIIKGKTSEEIIKERNDYQRNYMRAKRDYEWYRDTMIEITGDYDCIPLWRDRETDTPWGDKAPTAVPRFKFKDKNNPEAKAKRVSKYKRMPLSPQNRDFYDDDYNDDPFSHLDRAFEPDKPLEIPELPPGSEMFEGDEDETEIEF